VTDLYTVRIPDWSDGRHLDLTNIEADGPEGATAKAVEWVNRRAGYHYCDRLPATPLQPHNGRDALADAYQEALDLVVYLRQEIAEREDLRAERDKLRAFKDWVHAFLDAQGIPADPDPEETAWTGCRIGCRMRYLTAERDRLRAQIKGHCDRIAAQSELLSRRAEAP
jgi:hypothetical protein